MSAPCDGTVPRHGSDQRCRSAGQGWWLLLIAALLVAGAAACRHDERPLPHVIFVLIDTLRADRLGCYGNPRGLTPFLDELASRGTVFTHAYAPSSWTIPSIASLYTSRYPSQHRVHAFASKLAASEVTLAERLTEAGYFAAGFVANFQLKEDLGYAQGFSEWNIYRKRDGIPAADMLPFVRNWANRPPRGGPSQPRFLYLHYLDPHSPYTPPEPFRSRLRSSWLTDETATNLNQKLRQVNFKAISPHEMEGLASLYDGEIASLDDALRKTFGELTKHHLLENAIVVITADHGEEFLEHGHFLHGYALNEESVRIPLIFLGPQITAGRRVDENVSLIDVAPTLLDLLGLGRPPSFEGRSLAPWVETGVMARARAWLADEGRKEVLIELPSTGSRLDLRAHSAALLEGSLKLLLERRGSSETEVPVLFDLDADPDEEHPNPPGRDGAVARLQASLRTMQEDLATRAVHEEEKGSLDEATKEKLRALGYAP